MGTATQGNPYLFSTDSAMHPNEENTILISIGIMHA
jgi:hypothetical protein